MAKLTEHIQGIDGGVVVGVDGSPGARLALRFALDDARRRGTTLHVVRAWGIANAPRPRDVDAGYVPSFAEFAQACQEQVHAEVRRVGGPDLSAGPESGAAPVAVHVLHGTAALALLEASEHADVVVVGSRGHGGFAGLLLGSTSEQVVHHAWCPVVVVPARVRGH